MDLESPLSRLDEFKKISDEQELKQIGEGLNLDNPNDSVQYITRGIAAIQAGNSSKILRNECIKNIAKLKYIGAISDDEQEALLNLV